MGLNQPMGGTCDNLDQWPGGDQDKDLTNQEINYGWPIEVAHVTYLLSHGDINWFEPTNGRDMWHSGPMGVERAGFETSSR